MIKKRGMQRRGLKKLFTLENLAERPIILNVHAEPEEARFGETIDEIV